MTYDPTQDFPFLKDTEPRIDRYRDQAIITIFGAYQEPYDNRLEKLRDFLQTNEFKKTHLVRDYTFPERNPQLTDAQNDKLQSQYWIQNSDVLIWVFFKNSDNTGVGNEFGELPFLGIDRLWRSAVFLESDDLENPIISRMIRATLDTYKRIQAYPFHTNNDSMLQSQAVGILPSFILQLLEDLKRR